MPPRVPVLIAAACLAALASFARGPRALPEGQIPRDARLAPLKDLDGYFPFQVPADRAAWMTRAERVRTQVLVTLGLWPMPTRSPLNPVIHGRVDQGDYTIEKVYFESAPGFYVTGNLYRPRNRAERVPGILCPHGHWTNGRFMDQGADKVRQEIVEGAERFEEGGRSPLQARCVTLARMGCVVFHYDMVGYADCTQLSMELAHGFAKQRPGMNDPENWGFFSPQAESRFQSIMGLQTWNSIRALDFLESLPDVDASRIGVTGASGGGTQTFILAAIDPRPSVAFPAVMVSTAMQGGCTCENASGLRVNTGNVEFAGLFAPKPLGMTAANDWTLEMPTKGFPDLHRLYETFGAGDKVKLVALPHFGHNYNYVSRSAMYSWFNRHLKLGLKEPIVEEDFPRLTEKELTVWDTHHPRPPGGEALERQVIQWWTRDAEAQLAALAENAEARRRQLQPAIDVVIGRTLKEVGKVEWELTSKKDHGSHLEMAGLLRVPDRQEVVPVVFLHPHDSKGTTVIAPTAEGKSGLYGSDDAPRPEVSRLLTDGSTVVGVDLLYQGEWLQPGKTFETAPVVKNPREAPAYSFGYNHTVFQQRVHDLLTVIAFVTRHENAPAHLKLMAPPGAGHWAACAAAVANGAVEDGGIHGGDFRFANVRDYRSPDFIPGGAKFLDPYILKP